MPLKKFEAAPEFFSNPDGISSLALAKNAGIRYADPPDGSELIPFVVSGSSLARSKVKTSFGHQVTKANVKHHSASTPFYSSLAENLTQLKAETVDWNPPLEATSAFHVSHINQLCSCPIGGLLVVVHHWIADTFAFEDPIIQVVASPAVAPLSKFSSTDLPGFNLSKAWDLTIPPFDRMPTIDTICPLLISSNDSSRSVSPPTIGDYLLHSSPLFLPSGEEVASTLTGDAHPPVLRAFFLPTVCSSPIGMFWSTKDLTADIMIKSVKALSPTVVSPYWYFLSFLEFLRPALPTWLQLLSDDSTRFSCKAYHFRSFTV